MRDSVVLGKLRDWIFVMSMAALIFALWAFLNVALQSVDHPLELEYLEGGMAMHAELLERGKPLFEGMSVDFMAYSYGPGLPVLASLVADDNFMSVMRKISIISTLLISVLILFSTFKLSGDKTASAFSAAVFLSAFKITDWWYHLARVDMIFVLFLTLGLILLLSDNWKWLSPWAFLFSTFFKQTGVFPLLFTIIITNKDELSSYLAAIFAFFLIHFVAFPWLFGARYVFNAFVLPMHHDILVWRPILWTLYNFFPILLLLLSLVLLGKKKLGKFSLFLLVNIFAFIVVFSKEGAHLNNGIPVVLMMVFLFVSLVSRLEGKNLLYSMMILQLAILLPLGYSEFIPGTPALGEIEHRLDKLSNQNISFWVVQHSSLGLDGEEGHYANIMHLVDMRWGSEGDFSSAVEFIEESLGEIDLVIASGDIFTLTWGTDVELEYLGALVSLDKCRDMGTLMGYKLDGPCYVYATKNFIGTLELEPVGAPTGG